MQQLSIGAFQASGAYTGDCMALLPQVPDGSVQCCVTSPPYFGLRSYLQDDHPDKAHEIGTEATPDEYVEKMVAVFRGVRRSLRDDGTCWLNLGDSYANVGKWGGASGGKHVAALHGDTGVGRDKRDYGDLKPKDLIGIPWRVAFALQADGWWLRQDIIWHKPSVMPESVTDRCTKAHEYVFLLTKSSSYFYDAHAIREPLSSAYSQDAIDHNGGVAGGERPDGDNFSKEARHRDGAHTPNTRAMRAKLLNPAGRNRRSVWSINPEPYNGAHFAVMPTELVKPCIMAGTSQHGACDRCGAPWERIVESHRTLDGKPVENLGSWKGENYAVGAQGIGHWRFGTERTEKGWGPTCKCENAGVRPCVVLDPFFGSGTVGRVAEDLGRIWLGFDLNPEYADLQRKRTAQTGMRL